ncbi:Senescence regulator S40 [Arabidopsis suecica]|uniref:Senescence regulator S40 n=1 Tax=Arabidopsis suecica TaxID=45249 RepID=A0A8T1ZY78_ARASU|nr:Senescence regulator S40 [Arabidopsis suecica]
MATTTRKSYYQRPSHRFLPTDRTYHITGDSEFEFDESDLYSSRSDSPDFRRKLITSNRRSSPATVTTTTVASSLPMNVPDWSKILGKENRHIRRKSIDNDDDGDGGKLPPHEYLAKTRMASFSVHEGIGRTLKGRDMSRVRNAILEKTGFLD